LLDVIACWIVFIQHFLLNESWMNVGWGFCFRSNILPNKLLDATMLTNVAAFSRVSNKIAFINYIFIQSEIQSEIQSKFANRLHAFIKACDKNKMVDEEELVVVKITTKRKAMKDTKIENWIDRRIFISSSSTSSTTIKEAIACLLYYWMYYFLRHFLELSGICIIQQCLMTFDSPPTFAQHKVGSFHPTKFDSLARA